MLNLNSIMIGTSQQKVMADFYEKVLQRAPDMADEGGSGWQIGSCFLMVASHSEVEGKSKEPQRILINLETAQVKEEFERIESLGAEVIKAPYEMGMDDDNKAWVATFADPDGNYIQLMTPWEMPEEK